MYKSVFAIVSLWFVISVNTAAAHDSRVPYATQLTDGEIAYIYLLISSTWRGPSVETLLPTVKEPALAAHLKEVLPAFKKHLAMTIEASRKLNIPDQNDHGGRSCVRSLT